MGLSLKSDEVLRKHNTHDEAREKPSFAADQSLAEGRLLAELMVVILGKAMGFVADVLQQP